MIAEKVLSEEGQFAISKLLAQGRIGEAKVRVLEGVNSRYWDWDISFEDAAEFYILLDVPSDNFPQRQNQAFF